MAHTLMSVFFVDVWRADFYAVFANEVHFCEGDWHLKKYFIRYTANEDHQKITSHFFCSINGREPVREWLKSLDPADRKTIGEDIAYVQYKWPLGKPRVDYLRESVWEVRSQIGN